MQAEESMTSRKQTDLSRACSSRGGIVRAALLAVCISAIGGCQTDAGDTRDPLANSESELTGWKGIKTGTPDPRDVAEGRRIAQRECSTCHAIDRSSSSPNPGAPPFRDVLFLNDSNWVAYRLIDAVRMGHDNMPLFDFDVRSADALIAYIESIESGVDTPKP
jgi:mono/diheme cytochrome c family protein